MSDFVICINNDSNPASLLVGKVYRTLPEQKLKRTACCALLTKVSQSPTAIFTPHSCLHPSNCPKWQSER
jgi:hypothetical protein